MAKGWESSVTTKINTNYNTVYFKKGITVTFYNVIYLQGRTAQEQSETVPERLLTWSSRSGHISSDSPVSIEHKYSINLDE